jgi:hypothetical protein
MKKLITTLFVATLGFSLVARAGLYPKYDLTLDGVNPAPTGTIAGIVDGVHNNAFPILEPVEPVQFQNGYRIYEPSESLTMNYKASDTMNRNLPSYHDLHKTDPSKYIDGTTYHNVAHVSFTTNQDTYLGIWTDIDDQATNEPRIDLTLNITDYGIYFLEEDVNNVHTYYSLKSSGIEVEADKAFGVYYKDGNTGEVYTTTDNWVGSFDSGNHTIDDPNTIWFSDTKVKTSEAFFCLFDGTHGDWPTKLEWDHFEFGFVTGEPPAGQPLPGTLSTLLISGLCAAGLRKRNKKH